MIQNKLKNDLEKRCGKNMLTLTELLVFYFIRI